MSSDLLSRKRGLILNLGSFAGSTPSPMLATYSGSKAFLATWTQALGKEVESKGITVQLSNTYFVVCPNTSMFFQNYLIKDLGLIHV